jgi:hypothetical protein
MFNFDEDTYDMDEAIEQETFAEDMYGFPELVSAGQQAPEDPMQSWIEAFQDDQVFSARGEDDEVASVPSVPLGWSPPTPTSGRSSGSATSTLLPFASRACGPQDSTSPLDNLPRVVNPAFTYAATRRRLRGKRGDAEVARDALAAVALRARPHYQAFRKLSRAAQKQARSYVRVYLNRRVGIVKDGRCLKLKTGVSLHCRIAHDFERHQQKVRTCLLLELAMSDDAHPDHIGAAACRWYEETGEAPKPVNRHPAGVGFAADTQIKSNQVLLTWHGDFGASKVKTDAMATMTMKDLERHVQQSASMQDAWDTVCKILFGVQERFQLAAMAFAMEICTRHWEQRKEFKIHVHGWMLQAFHRQRLTMEDVRLPQAQRPHLSM